MKIKSILFVMSVAMLAFSACDEMNPDKGKENVKEVRDPDFEANEEFPIEAWNNLAEGTDVGVTIEVTKVEDQNFVFELRPGAKVQSFKLDVYPLAQLYNNLLNDRNSGVMKEVDAVSINERIREYLFTEGSGGFAFSVEDFENAEDFFNMPFDWMNTPYSSSAVAIPDCGYMIAVVSSVDPDISGSNQEELTLCFVQTTSQPVEGNPTVEISVQTGYRGFVVTHVLNSDAGGVYYFGRATEEIDEYIDTFGDTLFRDFVRTWTASPIPPENLNALTYSKDYGEAADSNIKSTTCAVVLDKNMTPQEGYERQDFSTKELPETEKDPKPADEFLAQPVVSIIEDRIAAAYFEFKVNMPKDCGTFFYDYYTEAEKLELENGSASSKRSEARRLVREGYGMHNPNFAWNDAAPDGEKATGGASGEITINGWGPKVLPGTTVYVGFVGRNGYLTQGPLTFSEPIVLDQRNMTTPENFQGKDLKLWIDKVTRTSFQWNVSYDPATVSMVYIQYMSADNNPGLTVKSSWKDWTGFIFDQIYSEKDQMNVPWPTVPGGYDHYNAFGFTPGKEYTLFMCAEDFDGNISPMCFATTTTNEVLVGPDPTVNINIEEYSAEKTRATFVIDHDAKMFFYGVIDSVDELNIPGATQASLNNIKESGIEYEEWRDAIYDWVVDLGLSTNYQSTYEDFDTDKVAIVACAAVGVKVEVDDDGNEIETDVYKFSHLICKDGEYQTLEEIFGIEE